MKVELLSFNDLVVKMRFNERYSSQKVSELTEKAKELKRKEEIQDYYDQEILEGFYELQSIEYFKTKYRKEALVLNGSQQRTIMDTINKIESEKCLTSLSQYYS